MILARDDDEAGCPQRLTIAGLSGPVLLSGCFVKGTGSGARACVPKFDTAKFVPVTLLLNCPLLCTKIYF